MSELFRRTIEDFQRWSPESAKMAGRACRTFPGGDTRMSDHYAPYPLLIEESGGAQLRDADGHELTDFMNNFTSLILGHADPAVVSSVTEQMMKGSAHAAPTRSQVALGELIRERVPSVEQLRFTASGSEATLTALRCARAFNGRDKVMKMEGGYHGAYELAEVSLVPVPSKAGPANAPTPVPIDESASSSLLGDAVICPYNNPDAARALIKKHADDLAAIIVEPVLSSLGMIPASPDFLKTLREEASAHDIVLIFDEVISLRLAVGGAQSAYGIVPDLTAMGKIIGGGLPIGAFGGREDLMRVFHPAESRPVMHSSTFSGNAVSTAAGFAAMSQVDSELIDRINDLGERLRAGLNREFEKAGIAGQSIGAGSLSNIHFTDEPIHDSRATLKGLMKAGDLIKVVHLMMLQRGVFSAKRLMFCTSAAMTDAHVDHAIDAFADTLDSIKPALKDEAPGILL